MRLSQQISKLRSLIHGGTRKPQPPRRNRLRRLLVEQIEPRRLLTTIDLAALAAGQGTTIFGADAGDFSGISVSSAGDVNGDGFDDMIVGAQTANGLGNAKLDAGESYVIFGAATLPATIDLANLGSAGITIFGADANDGSGISVSSAGDVNGDGFDDLMIGAWLANGLGNAKSFAGDTYVIFGAATLPATIDLANLGSAGITIFGADSQDRMGWSVSSAGDVNGDGFADLMIGAYRPDEFGIGKSDAGASYVIFGAVTLPATIDLENLGKVGQPAGITILGADLFDNSGRSVSSAGDINGDGFDDLMIGARYADALDNAISNAGETYLVFGAATLPATIHLATLGKVGQPAGITIFGAETEDFSGRSVSSAGDINGDGFSDLIIGAYRADASANAKSSAGDSYVIFGAAVLPSTIDLANLGQVGQPAGITIFGADSGDFSGISVSSAGDINGDGVDDLMIGAWASAEGNTKTSAGESYVIFGAATLPATIDLATLGQVGQPAGITIFGVDVGDLSGDSTSSAGDVNGDGFDDLIIGAWLAAASGNAKPAAGESYVIFGGNGFTNSILAANLGTSATETITGTSAAEILNGADGDDTLVGSGGADVLIGGRGNDVLAISDLDFNRIVGGNGNDTLRLDGSGLSLDLTSVRDNRLIDIEVIDITGSGDNTLVLNHLEVLNLSSTTNTLLVRRNFGDTISIGSGWTLGDEKLIDWVRYQTFTQGLATLLIEVPTPVGTSGDDVFVLSYSSTNNTGNVSISRSANGNPVEFLGVWPMSVPLVLNTLAGTDSVRIEGTSGSDTMEVTSTDLNINGHTLFLLGVETRTLAGHNGNDTYRFDADAALGSWNVDESIGGSDTIDFSQTTSRAVTLNLGLATPQTVNANLTLGLGFAVHFENAIGGSLADTLTGNALQNILTGGPGNDTLNGSGGNDHLYGGLDNDTYVFDTPTDLEADEVSELFNQGNDTLSFASIETTVSFNLGSRAVQSVHANRTLKLNSQATFENIIGGAAADTLIGNLLNNSLTGNAGNDTLFGRAGNDTLFGGLGDDTYIFAVATVQESDFLIESIGQGTDTISFASLPIDVRFNLASNLDQVVHTNRVLRLSSGGSFENVAGGSGNDVLLGNNLNNYLVGGKGNNILVGSGGDDTLVGGNGRDILIGGLGLDTLDGGSSDDILIAGRTFSDTSVAHLSTLRNEWVSIDNYATRVAQLRAGVGVPLVSLIARTNVLRDRGEDDVLTGGAGNDWYFAAVDDVITDLFAGEVTDLL